MASPGCTGQGEFAAALLDQASASAFDMFNLPDGYFENPYPWFRALRDHDPVHRNSDGTVLLTRHDDVRTVWRDPSAVVNKSEMFLRKFGPGDLYEHHTTGMLFRDPPDHDRLRAVAAPFFTVAAIQQLSQFVADLVDGLIEEAQQCQRFDIVRDIAARIPVQVINKVIGLPPEDGEQLRAIGLRVLFPLNPSITGGHIRSGNAAVSEFADYLREHISRIRARKVRRPPPSLLESLVAAEASAQISEAEIVHMCLLMLDGGFETTTNLIALGTLALMEHPDAACELASAPEELVGTAVEEMTRYVTPLQLQGRRCTRSIELPSGQSLAAGTEVVLCQASANHDERRFANPDSLDLHRKPNPHLSFGLGVHICIGRSLARLESLIALPRIVRAFTGLELTGRPVFTSNVRFRGLASLPVRVDDRTAR